MCISSYHLFTICNILSNLKFSKFLILYYRWNPDAIVFDSWQSYGTPSYWIQMFFRDSSGATLVPSLITVEGSASNVIMASVIRRYDDGNDLEYLDIKVLVKRFKILRTFFSL